MKVTLEWKKPPIKPIKAPICHILNPVMPIEAKMPKIVSEKNQPTIRPDNAPIKVDKIIPKKKNDKNVRHPPNRQPNFSIINYLISETDLIIGKTDI